MRQDYRHETRQSNMHNSTLYTDAIHQVMRPQPIIVCCVIYCCWAPRANKSVYL